MIAVRERILPDIIHITGQCDRDKAPAVLKSVVIDRFHCRRQADGSQAAVLESAVLDGHKAVRHGERFHHGGAAESISRYRRHTRGDRESRQRGTAVKTVIPHGTHTVRQLRRGQGGRVPESGIAHLGQAFPEADLGHPGLLKGAFPDGRDDTQGLEIPDGRGLIEGISRDLGHARRQGDARDAAAREGVLADSGEAVRQGYRRDAGPVLKGVGRDTGDAFWHGEGHGGLLRADHLQAHGLTAHEEIFQVQQRILRAHEACAGTGQHPGGVRIQIGVHGGAGEGVLADLLQLVGQRDLREERTAVEGPGADHREALGQGHVRQMRAVGKGFRTDAGDALGDHHADQAVIAPAQPLRDHRHAGREGHVDHRGAGSQGRHADLGHGLAADVFGDHDGIAVGPDLLDGQAQKDVLIQQPADAELVVVRRHEAAPVPGNGNGGRGAGIAVDTGGGGERVPPHRPHPGGQDDLVEGAAGEGAFPDGHKAAGQSDCRKIRTAGKSIGPDQGDGRGKIDRRQARAAGERVGTDLSHGRGQIQDRQARTAGEGIIADDRQPVGQRKAGQPGAAGEGPVGDLGEAADLNVFERLQVAENTGWQRDDPAAEGNRLQHGAAGESAALKVAAVHREGLQPRAVHEGIGAHHGVPDRDGLQSGAAGKRLIADISAVPVDGHGLQAGQPGEHVALDGLEPRAYGDVRQGGAPGEHAAAKGRQAVRQGNGEQAVAVAERTAAQDGQRSRDRRGDHVGAVIERAGSDLPHTGGKIDRCDRGAVGEGVAADAGKGLRQVRLRKGAAAVEGLLRQIREAFAQIRADKGRASGEQLRADLRDVVGQNDGPKEGLPLEDRAAEGGHVEAVQVFGDRQVRFGAVPADHGAAAVLNGIDPFVLLIGVLPVLAGSGGGSHDNCAVKGRFAAGDSGGGQGHLRQAAAVKGIASNRRDAGRERDAPKGAAVLESLRADNGHAVWDRDGRKIRAVLERIIADRRHGLGDIGRYDRFFRFDDVQAGHIPAAETVFQENIRSLGSTEVIPGPAERPGTFGADIGQALDPSVCMIGLVIAIEGLFAHGGDAVRDRDAAQSVTFLKSAFTNRRHTARDRGTRHHGAVVESVIADARHAVRQDDGMDQTAAAVPGDDVLPAAGAFGPVEVIHRPRAADREGAVLHRPLKAVPAGAAGNGRDHDRLRDLIAAGGVAEHSSADRASPVFFGPVFRAAHLDPVMLYQLMAGQRQIRDPGKRGLVQRINIGVPGTVKSVVGVMPFFDTGRGRGFVKDKTMNAERRTVAYAVLMIQDLLPLILRAEIIDICQRSAPAEGLPLIESRQRGRERKR